MPVDATPKFTFEDPAFNYFAAVVCFGVVGLVGMCILRLVQPWRNFVLFAAAVALLHLLLALTTLFSRALIVVYPGTGRRELYASREWIYVDTAAHMLAGLLMLTWSVLGVKDLEPGRRRWRYVVPVATLAAAFYPALANWQPAADVAAVVMVPAAIIAALVYHETRTTSGRRRVFQIGLVAVPAWLAYAVACAVFQSGAVSKSTSDYGASILRLFETPVLTVWVHFWVQSERQQFTWCCECDDDSPPPANSV